MLLQDAVGVGGTLLPGCSRGPGAPQAASSGGAGRTLQPASQFLKTVCGYVSVSSLCCHLTGWAGGVMGRKLRVIGMAGGWIRIS